MPEWGLPFSAATHYVHDFFGKEVTLALHITLPFLVFGAEVGHFPSLNILKSVIQEVGLIIGTHCSLGHDGLVVAISRPKLDEGHRCYINQSLQELRIIVFVLREFLCFDLVGASEVSLLPFLGVLLPLPSEPSQLYTLVAKFLPNIGEESRGGNRMEGKGRANYLDC